MAELAAGALGGLATVGAAALGSAMGFTARHDHSHDCQVDLAQRFMHTFEEAHKQGSVDDNAFEVYLIKKESDAQNRTRAYFESIEDFKNISCFRVYKKIQQKNVVRRNKREVRRAIRDLREHYDSAKAFATFASDSSSITAVSGTPTEAAHGRFKVSDWLD
ncbi:hypothetical protein BKA70DRAFT_1460257, partial [Coprinopsis sp. MPI-PUGE-AT-0042]